MSTTIGAYGNIEDPKPILRFPLGVSGILTSRDSRLMDLDLQGPGGTNTGIGLPNLQSQSLVLRLDVHGFRQASLTSSPDNRSDVIIQESTLVGSPSYGLYFWSGPQVGPLSSHIALLGSYLESPGSHDLRTYITKSLIEHNDFGNTKGHQIKFCGGNGDAGSQFSIISDNTFSATQPAYWSVAIGPQDSISTSTQYASDVIVERNKWNGNDGQIITAVQSRGADNVTVRNNVFINVFGAIGAGDGIPGWSTWKNWKAYGNTLYSTLAWTSLAEGFDSSLEARNNLIYSTCLYNQCAFGVLPGTNTSNNIVYYPNMTTECINAQGSKGADYCVDPNFLTTDPASQDFLRIDSGSPAYDTGTAIAGYFEDHSGNGRPKGGGYDIGAHEY